MSIIFILCCTIDWQPVISAIPSVSWGILLLVLICVLLRHVVSPLIANRHEISLKKVNFDQERFWYFQKKLEQDFKEELTKRINDLEKGKDALSQQLKEERKDREKMLKEERIQAEHDFYEKVLSQFCLKEENQSK